jgi:hypothetical protein
MRLEPVTNGRKEASSHKALEGYLTGLEPATNGTTRTETADSQGTFVSARLFAVERGGRRYAPYEQGISKRVLVFPARSSEEGARNE